MPDFSIPYYGAPGTTVRKVAGDTSKSLEDHNVTLTSGSKGCILAVVSVESNAVRMAFGTDPTQGAAGVGHKFAANDVIYLHGPEISQANFINETNSSDAILQITVYF